MTEPSPPEDLARELRARTRPFLGTAIGDDHGDQPAAGTPGLRPFVLTSGRVGGAHSEIGVETQVSARSGAASSLSPRLTPELQAIVALCAEPLSVAEISARLRLHLGVAMVLVGDLSDSGHVDIHSTGGLNIHDPDMILRVMRGLRAIS